MCCSYLILCLALGGVQKLRWLNFANYWPPTYPCLHWLTFGLPPTYHYKCKRWHVINIILFSFDWTLYGLFNDIMRLFWQSDKICSNSTGYCKQQNKSPQIDIQKCFYHNKQHFDIVFESTFLLGTSVKTKKSQHLHRTDHLPTPCWHLLTFGQPPTYLVL